MAGVALIGLVWTSVETVSTRRQIAQQTAHEGCKSAADSNCQSLAINLRSAVANEVAADFAGQQMWLNIFGLLGLTATVVYAAAAWREARESAQAAIASIEHLKVIERAYLYGAIDSDKAEDGATSVDLRFAVSNLGKTPARLQEFWLGVFPAQGKIIGYPARPDYSGARYFRSDTIFAADERQPKIHTIDGAPLNGMAYGQFYYLDIFGRRWTSRFALIYNAVEMTSQVVGGDEWNYSD